MKSINKSNIIMLVILLAVMTCSHLYAENKQLNVVTTLPDYADFARQIGGEYVSVKSIVQGNQDAHFIRPKPSFVLMVRNADILIATGLDLEMWLPTVVDKAGNQKVRSGEPGYVAVSRGMHLKEIPTVMSKINGGLHVYGNPHLTVSPLNMVKAIENICIGLVKNAPKHKQVFEKKRDILLNNLYAKMYGKTLVTLLGGNTLARLTETNRLISFLENKSYKGEKLINKLGGWMKLLMPMRGMYIVTYHKNWRYFTDIFGLKEGGFIEPKPGIPPSPKHTEQLKNIMIQKQMKIIMAANYFDEKTVKNLAKSVGAQYFMVPYYSGSTPDTDTYFKLVDTWVNSLVKAAKTANIYGNK